MGWGRSGFICWGVSRPALVLCIWNVAAVSLFLPSFGDTSSRGSHPGRVVCPLGFTLDDCFLTGNK